MKQVNVWLEEAVHTKVKAKAGSMGITLQAAYDDALKRWAAEDDPGTAFTLEDLRRLARFWTNPADKGDEWLKKSLQYRLDQRYS